MKIFRTLTLLIVAFFSVAAWADGKTGVINLDRVLRESDPAKRATKKLDKEFEKRGELVEKLHVQVQRLQEELEKGAGTLADQQRRAKEKELADASREFQRRQRELSEDLNARRNEELQAVIERANKAVRQVAEKEGFDLILQDAAYVNPRIDITDKVIKVLADPSPAK